MCDNIKEKVTEEVGCETHSKERNCKVLEEKRDEKMTQFYFK